MFASVGWFGFVLRMLRCGWLVEECAPFPACIFLACNSRPKTLLYFLQVHEGDHAGDWARPFDLGTKGLGFINIMLAHMAHGIIPKTLSAKPHPAHPSASPTKMCGFEHCGILSNFPISDRSSQRELPPLAARQQPADWAGSSRYQDAAREPRPEEDHGCLRPPSVAPQAAPPTVARRRDRALRCDPAT